VLFTDFRFLVVLFVIIPAVIGASVYSVSFVKTRTSAVEIQVMSSFPQANGAQVGVVLEDVMQVSNNASFTFVFTPIGKLEHVDRAILSVQYSQYQNATCSSCQLAVSLNSNGQLTSSLTPIIRSDVLTLENTVLPQELHVGVNILSLRISEASANSYLLLTAISMSVEYHYI